MHGFNGWDAARSSELPHVGNFLNRPSGVSRLLTKLCRVPSHRMTSIDEQELFAFGPFVVIPAQRLMLQDGACQAAARRPRSGYSYRASRACRAGGL